MPVLQIIYHREVVRDFVVRPDRLPTDGAFLQPPTAVAKALFTKGMAAVQGLGDPGVEVVLFHTNWTRAKLA